MDSPQVPDLMEALQRSLAAATGLTIEEWRAKHLPKPLTLSEHQPRERAVMCAWCGKPTWKVDGICDHCADQGRT